MSDWAVELNGVTKRFGDFTAVDRLDLRLPKGGIVGFLGPNGAGKTTTLRMLLGLYAPDAGEVRVLGGPVGKMRDRIGYLPEERGLYRRARADDAIAYIASLKGLPRREAKKRARALLERFGLGDFRPRARGRPVERHGAEGPAACRRGARSRFRHPRRAVRGA
jgi:ABC-2 type transport system ATP-binding protein